MDHTDHPRISPIWDQETTMSQVKRDCTCKVKWDEAEELRLVPIDIEPFKKRILVLCPVNNLNEASKRFGCNVQGVAEGVINFGNCSHALGRFGNIYEVIPKNKNLRRSC